MNHSESEYKKALRVVAETTVYDFGGNRYDFGIDEWREREIDRVMNFLLSDEFNMMIDDVVVEYNEVNERIRAREEEGDQALELRREP